jgi:RimJ/RimL family protein N-acetyltransferase
MWFHFGTGVPVSEDVLLAMTAIDTPRLLLRLPESADAVPFMEMFQDPELIERKQVTLVTSPGGIDVAIRNIEGMLQHWQLRQYGLWAVVERATGQVVGCVGLQYPSGWPRVELAWIIHRSRWGSGFATEAGRAALRWVWERTEIEHMISLINANDFRSMRVATKIGEHFERTDIDPINSEPVHVYGIHRPLNTD